MKNLTTKKKKIQGSTWQTNINKANELRKKVCNSCHRGSQFSSLDELLQINKKKKTKTTIGKNKGYDLSTGKEIHMS